MKEYSILCFGEMTSNQTSQPVNQQMMSQSVASNISIGGKGGGGGEGGGGEGGGEGEELDTHGLCWSRKTSVSLHCVHSIRFTHQTSDQDAVAANLFAHLTWQRGGEEYLSLLLVSTPVIDCPNSRAFRLSC